MFILDTDHRTVLEQATRFEAEHLRARLKGFKDAEIARLLADHYRHLTENPF